MIDPDACRMQDILHKSYPAKCTYYDADTIVGVLRYIKYLETKVDRIADLEARLARVPDRDAVARALCDVTHAGADFGMTTDDVLDDPRGHEYWFRLADAAIAAMQEPTP